MQNINIIRTVLCLGMLTLGACGKFLNTDLDTTQVVSKDVFNDDGNAIAAVNGLYRTIAQSSLASGGGWGIPVLTGLSADELTSFSGDEIYVTFEQNNIQPNGLLMPKLWNESYNIIYSTNDIIEGVAASAALTAGVKKQLTGEALFARAFAHFHLANTFGDVPIVLTTDYKKNAIVSRDKVWLVYEQVVADLKEAQDLLTDEYQGTERTRANRGTVTALLARVYLYMRDWANAEAQATSLIDGDAYGLVEDPNDVFVKTSGETIWQSASQPPFNTLDGQHFVLLYGPSTSTTLLTDVFLSSFEPGDVRKTKWVGAYTDGGVNLQYPYKYKVAAYGAPITEHAVLFRLAEQYLIRAEARTQQDNLDGAIADVDEIRDRASLPLIHDTNSGISKADLLLAIERERRIELFTEGGHRWFDLKRTKRASAVLAPIKQHWTDNDTLYPIPQSERDQNPFLGEQNKGY